MVVQVRTILRPSRKKSSHKYCKSRTLSRRCLAVALLCFHRMIRIKLEVKLEPTHSLLIHPKFWRRVLVRMTDPNNEQRVQQRVRGNFKLKPRTSHTARESPGCSCAAHKAASSSGFPERSSKGACGTNRTTGCHAWLTAPPPGPGAVEPEALPTGTEIRWADNSDW